MDWYDACKFDMFCDVDDFKSTDAGSLDFCVDEQKNVSKELKSITD